VSIERLDLRLVEYFVAVAEERHFGRAAARLHIAQPSLSHQIRHLERQLGVVLLDRTSRRVELTPGGAVLLRQGKRLLAQAERAVVSTRAAAEDHVTVGFAGSAATPLLPEVLRRFAERNPSIQVSVRELLLRDMQRVLDGVVDVAFTRLIPGQLDAEVEVLARQPRLVALPAGHPLAGREAVTYRELRGERFITNPIDATRPPLRWLQEQRRHGLTGRVAAEAASVQEVLTLVAAGRGVCLVPEPAASLRAGDDVAFVPVTDAEPAVVSIVWRRANERPAVRAFVEAARGAADPAGT
jgi:DNA-binding transcriptional LysR family regulator